MQLAAGGRVVAGRGCALRRLRNVRVVVGAAGGHDTGAAGAQISEEELAVAKKYQEHQQAAARPGFAAECRTLVDAGRYATLSTNSRGDLAGFPAGSIVGYAAGVEDGLPVFAFSSMSAHTGDVQADGRCSLTVTAPGFTGAADGRVTLVGTLVAIGEDDKPAAREQYLAKHPDAFWVDFGDFSWWRMEQLQAVRLVGGFARAGGVTPEEYCEAEVDPVAQFSKPVADHMNDDHADSLVASVKHYVDIDVDDAKLLTLDRLGLNLMVTRGKDSFKLRLPFPEPAEDRKAVKEQIVAMSRAAAMSAAASAGAE